MNSYRQFGLLAAATILAYSPALRAGFIWDDDHHVTAPALLSLHGLGRIWTDLTATQQYYPVLHTAFWLEHHLWGAAPFGYHLLNVALHITVAGLFLHLLRRLAVPGATFAAVFFALHPVGVESVAWISEQKNTLSAIFYLSAALVYFRFTERTAFLSNQIECLGSGTLQAFRGQSADGVRNARSVPLPKPSDEVGQAGPSLTMGAAFLSKPYILATALYLLALLTKSVTATLPAALLVILWWQHGRLSWRRDVVPLLPWFALGLASGLFTIWIEKHYIGADGPAYALTAVQRIIVAGHAFWFYLGKLCFPADLLFIYPRWDLSGRAALLLLLYPTAALSLILLAVRWQRRCRAPLAALLLFVGTLFPALGFVNVYPFVFSFVADHFQYLAMLAPLAFIAALTDRFVQSPPGKIAAAAVLLILGTLTWRQCRIYRTAETLYRSTLAGNPDCWMAHNNLGLILADSSRVPEAIDHYQTALRLRPDYPTCEYNLGNAWRSAGHLPEAINCYETALREQPANADPDTENNLAVTLVAVGRAPEAIEHYRAALRARPNDGSALIGLSAAAFSAGDFVAAISAAQNALRIGADEPGARTNLGNALLRSGKIAEAIAEYETVVRLQPANADARFNLANAYVHAGRVAEAIAPLEEALRLRPDFPAARQNLAAIKRSLPR